METSNWHLRAKVTDFSAYSVIDGKNSCSIGQKSVNKYSPRDGSLLYKIPFGKTEHASEAVKIARESFRDKRWRGSSLHHRKAIIRKLANLVEVNQETFALYECLDTGKPISQALGEVIEASAILRDAADGADKLFSPYFADGNYCAYQLRKPLGVVGAIVSWNYPLVLAALKIGPALIMGNSLVLKPSECASLSAGYLATLALEAGVPPGVFNVVQGAGHVVGSTLAKHPDVDLLSFTGSSKIGKQIQMAAGQSNMKRLLLECGGKSPYLVFDDCPEDLDAIATDIVSMAFHNQSANCIAGTRLVIQDSIKEELLSKVIEQAASKIPQDPLDPDTTFGAIINEAHMNKVLAFIENGKRQGAHVVHGGSRVMVKAPEACETGFYIEPTIFDHVDPQQSLAREEIFGPVLSVFTFNDEAKAIELANSSSFGLAAYLATENAGRAHRLSQEINAGLIMVVATSEPSDSYHEIGKEGLRESGFGIEGGLQGLNSYSAAVAVHQWS